MLDMNLFGITYNGADVCGFFEDTTEELCSLWTQMGSFYPFMRNHNAFGQTDQDPAVYSSNHHAIVDRTLRERYSLLPELHDAFFHSHINGGTVVKSMVEVFNTDLKVRDIWHQFLWGNSLVIAPKIHLDRPNEADFYCAEDGTFDLQGNQYKKGDHTILTDPGVNSVFIRPNHAIYRQMAVGQTIEETRKSLFTIQAAYNGQSIQKQLFWDDNDNLDFETNHFMLNFEINSGDMKMKLNANQVGTNFAAPQVDAIHVYVADMVTNVEIPTHFIMVDLNDTSKTATLNAEIISGNSFRIDNIAKMARNSGIENIWTEIGVELIPYNGQYNNRLDCSNGKDCPANCNTEEITGDEEILMKALNVPTCFMENDTRFYDQSTSRESFLQVNADYKPFYYSPVQRKVVSNSLNSSFEIQSISFVGIKTKYW